MARRRTTRMTQEGLTAAALAQAHKFQKLAVMKLLGSRWHVQSVSFHPRTGDRMIVMRHDGDGKAGAACYPNGAVDRRSGTISWSWQRVADAATATQPDIFVKDLIVPESVGA